MKVCSINRMQRECGCGHFSKPRGQLGVSVDFSTVEHFGMSLYRYFK